ncbi:LysM peptidoglycan-binding domain-containing M23 family metallopeptidase [Rhodoplanes sp. TEM]|uniref:LysM peptidoglycan-binding domain-containing M23 family metallopeptidase n=1 Tax=Rhodoplanes tepidamans TaxID=200616 RepID=A0ABT5JJG9_RHOTP|nr:MULTISPECIES: LysM peptidoglycan-binding domain-containing M23 family metallopeptidase [Rhodoplanes]MDC7789746.1 LysM peptidoglycan-binding domain-containing M23 family metallopeptidase [Rhodoplanes tepidamans]MDC7987600.1 LysM peptidoglycan-binding domain-containing M23 family metallopeptidase [Rhodoplanes sp. TEM]MDQ0358887.1 murein DD-endopeptidase MepM/ murein hydrolase activator NlpD [Rhodoplanes tepidamans]
MRTIAESSSPYSVSRVLVLLIVGFGVANCSTDSTRLAESPLQNPYAGGARPSYETTGAVPHGQGVPVGRVDSRPLGQPVAAQPLPPPSAPPQTYASYTPASHHGAVAGGGVAGGGRGMGSYQPASLGTQVASADVTGTVPRLQSPAKPMTAAAPGWQWEGGTPVTVAPGDTLSSLSKRYGVPVNVIAEANGLAGPAVLQPGRRLVIPRYAGPATTAAAAPAAPQAGPRVQPPAGGVHVVAPGETLVGIAKRYKTSIKDLAAANNIPPHAMLKMGDRLVIPGKGGRTALLQPKPAAAPAAAPAPAPVAQQAPPLRTAAAPPAPAAQQAPTRVASIEPQATASVHRTTVADPPADEDDKAARNGALSFRWPVKGRVIASFGKANGQQNDGINLAVPEGTAVRAAEDGIVAYAGSELKGYGNLVLIRHANGFVTAYAHNSELMVKRNDQVRRGQVIAKSGQTGTVSSPQLHFEIRKGSAPIDPMQHLPGA